MPAQPLGPTGLLAQSMTLPAGSQSMSMGGMGLRAQGVDGRKKGGAGNWLGLSGNAQAQWAIDGAVDGQGNLFLAGDNSNTGYLQVGRYAATGERNWSAEVVGAAPGGGFTAGNIGSAAIATDAAGNAYVVSGNGSTTVETLKISPAGQLVWGRTYTAGTNAFGRAVAVGASGSVYVLARTDGGGYGGSTVLVVKYNAAGAFQWSRNVDLQVGYGLALDASENVYVSAPSSNAIAKISAAGAFQWASQYSAGDAPGTIIRMAASASGEAYAACGALGDARLWAFDASGAVRWARGLGPSGGWWNDVLLSGQSLYCIGVTNAAGAGLNDILLAEYDTSGTLKWQRTIGGAGNDYGFAIAEADANTLAIYGSTSLGAGAGDVFIGRVPKSGPPAGKIGPYTVTVSSLTPANLSSTFTGISPATQTLGSDAASSLTPTSIALTTSIYPF